MKHVFIITICLIVSSCASQKGKHSQPLLSDLPQQSIPPGISVSLALSPGDLSSRTGIYTLENGGESLLSRLWFFDNAKTSIDIQYYSFAKDVTGLVASDRLVMAAERGVKVRILIDDAASRMYSHEIQLLDSHENIEIRVYNAGLMLGRIDRRLNRTIKNSNRLLRRMHNKTFTIDNVACITGGRNIADEYFDYDHKFNFRDRDVILFGKVVKDVTTSFDNFWNHKLTVPYTKLSGRKAKKKYSDSERFKRLHRDAEETKDFSQGMRQKVKEFPEEIRKAKQSGQMQWVTSVSFVSDVPGKNEDRKNRKGGICSDSLAELFKQAKTSIDIQSPYFILTDESKALITETIKRGVKIRLLTNSLAAIDNIEAFSGYQKDREEILKAGVQIFEFKPHANIRFKLMIPEVQEGINYKAVYGLHSKTLIIDGRITAIGSYNLDPRSENLNTECIAIIRSKEVADNLSKWIEEEFKPENAWQVSLDYNPDAEAGMKKRFKAFSRRIIPKKLL
jgi:phosphatidylserine/phosphatidylglycerophosphate/cardiolipin synthase-like enzyme